MNTFILPQDLVAQHFEKADVAVMLNMAFRSYFIDSYFNEYIKAESAPAPWLLALWQLRENKSIGRKFTDHLVAYTFKLIIDTPGEGWDADSRVYFVRKLKVADSIIDNESAKWPEIENTFKRNGFDAKLFDNK